MVFQKHLNLKIRKWSLSRGFNSVSKYFRTHHVQMRAFSYYFLVRQNLSSAFSVCATLTHLQNDSTKGCRGMKLLLSINKNNQLVVILAKLEFILCSAQFITYNKQLQAFLLEYEVETIDICSVLFNCKRIYTQKQNASLYT